MAHVAYPSTPNFKNCKSNYDRSKAAANDLSVTPDSESSTDLLPKRHPSRGTFLGTVKLHGTNATIVFSHGSKTPQIQARSWIIQSTSKDNSGTFALLSKIPLSQLVDQILAVQGCGNAFDEIYVCGEIAGRGVQRGVAITQLEYKSCALPGYRLYNIAQYKTFEIDIDFDSEESTTEANTLMNELTAEVCAQCPFAGAFEKDGQQIVGAGEGIVWTMVSSGTDEFDDTLLVNFKTKGDQFSTVLRPPKNKKSLGLELPEACTEFADYALGERRMEQGIEYLEGEQARQGLPIAGIDIRLIGPFIKWVVDDAIREERNEMERLSIEERDAKKVLGARVRAWYMRKCNE
ncbi:unnamed protein product [Mycena citricolor]|uniref:RNA ligase domain-containing protein n=1 Tax=Mycena citricolor TaxID=2018698 RepID=A0AAD2K7Q0_9AGAR|nr:unnamed protein product [Mycena citricolor]